MRRRLYSTKSFGPSAVALAALVATTAVPLTAIAADRMVLCEEWTNPT